MGFSGISDRGATGLENDSIPAARRPNNHTPNPAFGFGECALST